MALNKLIKDHLLPFLIDLEWKGPTNSSFIREIRAVKVGNEDQMIITSIVGTLFDIYKSYWPWEVKGKYDGTEDE